MWQPAEKAHASVLADRLHIAHDKLTLPDNWLSQNEPILLDDVFFLGPHHKLVCSPMRDPDNARRLKRVLTVEGSGSNLGPTGHSSWSAFITPYHRHLTVTAT